MKSFAGIACAFFAILFSANAQIALAVPTVALTSPAAAANFGAPAAITITATATPSAGTTITKVEFFRGGTTLIGTVTASPYTFAWTNVAIGNYSLTAKATDSAAGTKTSTARAITVKANVVPAVNISSPAANANFAAPANITINATATDTDGTIAMVEFFNGATLLGTDTTSPYAYTWTGVATGSYALTAKATDNSGGVKTSPAVTVNAVTPPTVNITAPATNATFAAPATVAISASAAAAAGATISKVEFFNGVTLLGTDTTSPYAFSWTNVAAGNYALTAKATDSK
ncbi:MAG: Ig-like domain-containing protein [Betaproteobacteria bacterium]